jgi:uncharacterized protein YjbI with pentapeptide repeats
MRGSKDSGFFFPLVLIAAGTLLLLSNYGFLPLGFWGTVFRFWPVLLILAGIDIAASSSDFWLFRIFGFLLGAAVLGGVIFFALSRAGGISGETLLGGDFSGKNLSGRDFSGANLVGANFANSSLSGVDFSGAVLIGANFRDADIRKADFSGAVLVGANFDGAKR